MSEIPTFETIRAEPSPTPDQATPSASAAEHTSTSFEAEHDLGEFRVADLDPGEGQAAAVIEADEEGEFHDPGQIPDRIGKPAFYETFEMVFRYPGLVDQDFTPLAIQPEEKPLAQATSDALYDLAEQYAPWLLEVDEKWMKLALVAQFGMIKLAVLREILAEKRRRKTAASPATGGIAATGAPEPGNAAPGSAGADWMQPAPAEPGENAA